MKWTLGGEETFDDWAKEFAPREAARTSQTVGRQGIMLGAEGILAVWNRGQEGRTGVSAPHELSAVGFGDEQDRQAVEDEH